MDVNSGEKPEKLEELKAEVSDLATTADPYDDDDEVVPSEPVTAEEVGDSTVPNPSGDMESPAVSANEDSIMTLRSIDQDNLQNEEEECSPENVASEQDDGKILEGSQKAGEASKEEKAETYREEPVVAVKENVSVAPNVEKNQAVTAVSDDVDDEVFYDADQVTSQGTGLDRSDDSGDAPIQSEASKEFQEPAEVEQPGLGEPNQGDEPTSEACDSPAEELTSEKSMVESLAPDQADRFDEPQERSNVENGSMDVKNVVSIQEEPVSDVTMTASNQDDAESPEATEVADRRMQQFFPPSDIRQTFGLDGSTAEPGDSTISMPTPSAEMETTKIDNAMEPASPEPSADNEDVSLTADTGGIESDGRKSDLYGREEKLRSSAVDMSGSGETTESTPELVRRIKFGPSANRRPEADQNEITTPEPNPQREPVELVNSGHDQQRNSQKQSAGSRENESHDRSVPEKTPRQRLKFGSVGNSVQPAQEHDRNITAPPARFDKRPEPETQTCRGSNQFSPAPNRNSDRCGDSEPQKNDGHFGQAQTWYGQGSNASQFREAPQTQQRFVSDNNNNSRNNFAAPRGDQFQPSAKSETENFRHGSNNRTGQFSNNNGGSENRAAQFANNNYNNRPNNGSSQNSQPATSKTRLKFGPGIDTTPAQTASRSPHENDARNFHCNRPAIQENNDRGRFGPDDGRFSSEGQRGNCRSADTRSDEGTRGGHGGHQDLPRSRVRDFFDGDNHRPHGARNNVSLLGNYDGRKHDSSAPMDFVEKFFPKELHPQQPAGGSRMTDERKDAGQKGIVAERDQFSRRSPEVNRGDNRHRNDAFDHEVRGAGDARYSASVKDPDALVERKQPYGSPGFDGKRGSYTLYIKGLPRGNMDALRQVFEKYGHVMDCYQPSRCEPVATFVMFPSRDDAERAGMALNGSTLNGSMMLISWANGGGKCYKCGRLGHLARDCSGENAPTPVPAHVLIQAATVPKPDIKPQGPSATMDSVASGRWYNLWTPFDAESNEILDGYQLRVNGGSLTRFVHGLVKTFGSVLYIMDTVALPGETLVGYKSKADAMEAYKSLNNLSIGGSVLKVEKVKWM